MKNILRSCAMVGAGFALIAWPQAGQSQEFYLNANPAVSLANDVALHSFLVPTPGAKVKLDPGAGISVAGGYNINDYLGVQFETGCNYNNVESISGRGNIDAGLSHIPMLGEVVVRYDRADCKWVPYAGAGAGGDASSIALDHVRAPNGQVVDNSATDVVFAWQAFAGVRYKFARNMSIGGGYKFFWADGASWDVRRSSGDIETGSARVHSFGVDFIWKF